MSEFIDERDDVPVDYRWPYEDEPSMPPVVLHEPPRAPELTKRERWLINVKVTGYMLLIFAAITLAILVLYFFGEYILAAVVIGGIGAIAIGFVWMIFSLFAEIAGGIRNNLVRKRNGQYS